MQNHKITKVLKSFRYKDDPVSIINYIHKDVEKSKLYEKFDVILMFEVLEHLDNWKKTIKKDWDKCYLSKSHL